LAAATDTAVAGADLGTGAGPGHLAELLVLGPLLACLRTGFRGTAAVVGYALALTATAAGLRHSLGTAGFAVDAATVALVGAFALYAVQRRGAADRRVLRVAEGARRAVLRPVAPEVAGVSMAARYHCLGAESGVGGDLYDIADTPFGLRVIVGDARGQGPAAAPLASAAVGHFRDLAYTSPDLVRLTRELDTRLAAALGPEDFVTVVLAEFGSDEVRLVNCGHPPPIRVGERLEPLAPAQPTPPLGIDPDPVQLRARLAPNERLLLYTDGLTEARDPDREMFAWTEAARRSLTGPLLDDSLDSLLALLRAHTAGALGDDLTLLLLQPLPRPAEVLGGLSSAAP
jgi:serine phosphatase RsbU (regulator of sigma subunit)